ncbi:helix-turn-helix transcriptional regulator [Chitinilyticum piscinae]|uniref:Helix-turn-helix domain-containing protein n=1 Tax=Chitinilyticum piscinae TaxID=2866724 RepID=A0A8J7FFW1_9NEIS|nr:AraC family transcriptional regulator [Chitinilyticum piscinae]MBE9608290.1 helix-turn-helix domain-containing protein [Chitinilyticum piscinae]
MSAIYLEQFDVDPANRQRSVGGRVYFHPCLPALQGFGILLLGVSDITHHYRVERDGAPFHVLVCCDSGSGWVLAGEERLRLQAGQMAILPAGSRSGLERDPSIASWRFSWYLLQPDERWPQLDQPQPGVSPCPDSSELYMAAALLAGEARRPLHARPQSSAALALLTGLLQRCLEPDATHPQRSRLDTLFARIDGDPARDWRVDELAAEWGVSSSQFHRLCVAVLGHSPRDEIVARRMRRARDLLLQRRGNVGEVAALVGYAEISSFSRRFTRHFGEAPGAIVRYLETQPLQLP